MSSLSSDGAGTWTAPDGYRVVRCVHEDEWVSWRVFRPGATFFCADVAYLHEAAAVVAGLRVGAEPGTAARRVCAGVVGEEPTS